MVGNWRTRERPELSRYLPFFVMGNAHACDVRAGRQTVIRMEKFRLIIQEAIDAKSPGWIFGKSCYKDVGPYLKNLPPERKGRDQDDLPWLSQERGEEDGESETSDVEALNEKIARLKKELAVAEKRAARGEKRKAKEGDKKAKDKKARRDDKRRGRSSCRPRSKDPKKKKARNSGQRKRRSHSFGSARDRKDKRSRKREHSQNLKLMERTRWAFRASGSDRSETETGMTEIQRRPQRWFSYCTDSQFFFAKPTLRAARQTSWGWPSTVKSAQADWQQGCYCRCIESQHCTQWGRRWEGTGRLQQRSITIKQWWHKPRSEAKRGLSPRATHGLSAQCWTCWHNTGQAGEGPGTVLSRRPVGSAQFLELIPGDQDSFHLLSDVRRSSAGAGCLGWGHHDNRIGAAHGDIAEGGSGLDDLLLWCFALQWRCRGSTQIQ